MKNASIYIEKDIEPSRHIELQIIADKYGNMVHLGERDCTIQRRHQKLLEEAPSPNITSQLRDEICKASLKIAKAVNYTNVGTIEFLVDGEGKYYFIEMNTRLQVEHPVTEMITGIDLVKEQLKIAHGERLNLRQKKIKSEGSAIECRINAEDPNNGFRPYAGKITMCSVPGGRGVRVDSHIYSGYEVPPYYDSLLGKLIVHQKTREDSIACMKRALSEYRIEGVGTTIPIHMSIIADPRFVSGDINTNFVENLINEKE